MHHALAQAVLAHTMAQSTLALRALIGPFALIIGAGAGPYPGVVVIHHMPGWDEATKEITRRFAAHGHLAICPNLHDREAQGAGPDDAAAAVRARGGVPDERFLGDAAGAVRHLRSMPSSNGKVGVIGYCSGGRQ